MDVLSLDNKICAPTKVKRMEPAGRTFFEKNLHNLERNANSLNSPFS